MAGPSLTSIRQYLAQEAGPYLSGTSTSGTTTSQLEDTGFGFKSSISQDGLFKDMYVFMPSVTAADKVRIIKTYTASAGTGTYDLVHGSAHTSTAYELHGIFEPQTVIPLLINEGLKECMIPAEFSFSPANNTDFLHTMATAAPWLTNPGWVRQVGVLSSGVTPRTRYRPTPIRGVPFMDGGTMYLDLGSFNTTDTIYVKCIKPAYFHCAASGGVYGSQNGLNLETDTVPDTVSVEWAAFAGLVAGWRRFGTILAASDKVKMSLKDAEDKFKQHDPGYGDSGDAERTFTAVRPWGPRC